MRNRAMLAALVVLMLGVGAAASAQKKPKSLAERVRHELAMLSNYTVFDWITYRVDGGVVTLEGAVTNPTLKSSAENVAKDVEGVTNIVNNIRVFSASFYDDSIRRQVFRRLYDGDSPLFRYGVGSRQSIHILVESGNVTLVGQVSSEADKNIAGIFSSQVPGVFSVKNNITVQAGS